AEGDGLSQFCLSTDFDLDPLVGLAIFQRSLEEDGKAATERYVVVFDKDAVLQIETVIDAAAAADGVFVECAEAGDGFAGVENFGFCVGYGFYELVGERGDAAHALHQVEDDPLAGEDGGGVVADDGEGLALFHLYAIEDFGVADD